MTGSRNLCDCCRYTVKHEFVDYGKRHAINLLGSSLDRDDFNGRLQTLKLQRVAAASFRVWLTGSPHFASTLHFSLPWRDTREFRRWIIPILDEVCKCAEPTSGNCDFLTFRLSRTFSYDNGSRLRTAFVLQREHAALLNDPDLPSI